MGVTVYVTVGVASKLSLSLSQFQAVLASPVDKSEASLAILRDELRQSQQSLVSWQESWRQAKAACEAWKKEAEDMAARVRHERDNNCRRIEEV